MTPEMEEFKDKVDDLLWSLESLPPDTSTYEPPENYSTKFEDALGYIWEAQSILQDLLYELEQED